MNFNKHLSMKTLTPFIFLFISAFAFGQSNTVSAGGDAEGDNGSVSFSIGQVVYTSAQSATGNINQGVQQPYDVGVVTGVEEIGINLSVFPNPTSGLLTLTVDGEDAQPLSYELFDASGRSVASKNNLSASTQISLDAFATGVYNLSVYRGNKPVKSFRIVRNY